MRTAGRSNHLPNLPGPRSPQGAFRLLYKRNSPAFIRDHPATPRLQGRDLGRGRSHLWGERRCRRLTGRGRGEAGGGRQVAGVRRGSHSPRGSLRAVLLSCCPAALLRAGPRPLAPLAGRRRPLWGREGAGVTASLPRADGTHSPPSFFFFFYLQQPRTLALFYG